jgi:hypothetical protein
LFVIKIGTAPFLLPVGNTVKRLTGRNWWIPVAASILFALYFSYSDVRSTLYTSVFEDPNLDQEISEIVGHSSCTVFVAYHYGLPLEYYGEFSGLPWPVSIDDPFYKRPDARELSIQERMSALGFTPEYIVKTNFELYDRKLQDLQAYLENECLTRLQTSSYLIYSGCQTQAVK